MQKQKQLRLFALILILNDFRRTICVLVDYVLGINCVQNSTTFSTLSAAGNFNALWRAFTQNHDEVQNKIKTPQNEFCVCTNKRGRE